MDGTPSGGRKEGPPRRQGQQPLQQFFFPPSMAVPQQQPQNGNNLNRTQEIMRNWNLPSNSNGHPHPQAFMSNLSVPLPRSFGVAQSSRKRKKKSKHRHKRHHHSSQQMAYMPMQVGPLEGVAMSPQMEMQLPRGFQPQMTDRLATQMPAQNVPGPQISRRGDRGRAKKHTHKHLASCKEKDSSSNVESGNQLTDSTRNITGKRKEIRPFQMPSVNVHNYNLSSTAPSMPFGVASSSADYSGGYGMWPQSNTGAQGLPPTFYPDPNLFYSEQVMRNYNNKPSSSVILSNEQKMRQFRKEAKRKEKMERRIKREKKRAERARQQRLNHNSENNSLRLPEMSSVGPLRLGIARTDDANAQNDEVDAATTQSSYRGVSWNKKERTYVARVWLRGKSEPLGRFREELRAAVAVDERLLELGVDDIYMLNFRTQLERDIALVILMNHHRMQARKIQKQKNTNGHAAAAALMTMGLNGIQPPPGVTNWPIPGGLAGDPAVEELLELGVPRDLNGNPNNIEKVLMNILKRNSSFQSTSEKTPENSGAAENQSSGQETPTNAAISGTDQQSSNFRKLESAGSGELEAKPTRNDSRMSGKSTKESISGDGSPGTSQNQTQSSLKLQQTNNCEEEEEGTANGYCGDTEGAESNSTESKGKPLAQAKNN